jgi:hypothetical protein
MYMRAYTHKSLAVCMCVHVLTRAHACALQGIIALVLDFEAMDAECAGDSWVWLYVLLVVVIPTSLGFVIGIVRSGLNLADLKGRFGW